MIASHKLYRYIGIYSLIVVVWGCSLNDLINVDSLELGSSVDQDVIESFEGARGAYYGAIGTFGNAVSEMSFNVGRFTDELSLENIRAPVDIDARRRLNSPSNATQGVLGRGYGVLQLARIQAQQAGDLLRKFGGSAGISMLAHTYAMRAYSVILMAEIYCSGIPVTSAPYGGKLEYTQGLNTEQLLRYALLLLDTADTYKIDSLPVLTMLRVARGRAYLNLGKYDSAAISVSEVETNHKATLTFDYSSLPNPVSGHFWSVSDSSYLRYVVKNGKGTNGIYWLAASAVNQDPRIPVSVESDGLTFAFPVRQEKYRRSTVRLDIATGVEARLIEAEFLMNNINTSSGNWLDVLNSLRTYFYPNDLSDTIDPGNYSDRLDLLFRERAFWLYLTGSRLGDMRRLIRHYGINPVQVFPFGGMEGSQTGNYGSEYVLVPELEGNEIEVERNPMYKGCFDREP